VFYAQLYKNISIIIEIKYNELFEINTILRIKTIINGCDTNVQKIIELDEN